MSTYDCCTNCMYWWENKRNVSNTLYFVFVLYFKYLMHHRQACPPFQATTPHATTPSITCLRAQPRRACLAVEINERGSCFVREDDSSPPLSAEGVRKARSGVEHARRGARESPEVLCRKSRDVRGFRDLLVGRKLHSCWKLQPCANTEVLPPGVCPCCS